MSAARAITHRIKSAKNISKITKAMEMVSASKMRRSQEQALASRPYAQNLQRILRKISLRTDSSLHPLLQHHHQGPAMLVIVSTDRGLVGGLNANLFRAVVSYQQLHPELTCVSIGKKAKLFVRKLGLPLFADFSDLPDKISYSAILPISTLVMKSFLDQEVNSVHVLHMQSETTITQRAEITLLLPLSEAEIEHPSELVSAKSEYLFEPSAKVMLDWLLPYYVENIIYFTMLEAKASEHSARMMAMKNASDNAKDIVKDLSLEYNRSRQAGITQELQEITTAQLSLT